MVLITLPATLRDRNRTRALARRPLSDDSLPCRIVGQVRAAHRLSRPSCGWRLGLAGRHTGRASNQPLHSEANGHASGAIRGPGFHAPRMVRPNGYDPTASDPRPTSDTRNYQNLTPFSSYRVPHQRHKRLLADSRWTPIARDVGKRGRAGEENSRNRTPRTNAPAVSTVSSPAAILR